MQVAAEEARASDVDGAADKGGADRDDDALRRAEQRGDDIKEVGHRTALTERRGTLPTPCLLQYCKGRQDSIGMLISHQPVSVGTRLKYRNGEV